MITLLSRRLFLRSSALTSAAVFANGAGLVGAQHHSGTSSLQIVRGVPLQPLFSQVRRLLDAADYLGSPLSEADRKQLDDAFHIDDAEEASETIQHVLDRYCLVGVEINPELRVKVARGPVRAELLESGWRQFLVKVNNQASTTAQLRGVSPQGLSLFSGGVHGDIHVATSDRELRNSTAAQELTIAERWLDVEMFNGQPLIGTLSGLALEYRIIQLYSRDAGQREATLVFNVGQGTQDLGFRSELPIIFDCLPAHSVKLSVRDEHGAPAIAAFVIRDEQGRIYPSQAKRLAPDFGFQPQVYRADGELLKLASGNYSVEFWRGPESIVRKRTLRIAESSNVQLTNFQIERWIDPSRFGWWSGDHHIHAAGCAHYTRPTEGARPEDMIRHTMGEDLKVGTALTWGGGFDYQKQFFTGSDHKVSRYPYLLHYDIEVSGFGSHQSGHLVLLCLKGQMYPGGNSTTDWPTLCLNTLRWAKSQGAICGYPHTAWGLEVRTRELPNYIVPPFDAGGAMEYIVDVTHELPGPDSRLEPAVDFIATCDTNAVCELNMWYHTLSVGFRTRIAGETDFPCVYADRVGTGRSYVKLDGKLNYREWCEGIRQGRSYTSDGKSHLLEFKVNDTALGASDVRLTKPGLVVIKVRAAALLSETPDSCLRNRRYGDMPFWDIERARIGDTREVPVEVVVNGHPVDKRNLVADGVLRDLNFDVLIEQSSWLTVRIFPSSHTNPIWIIVNDKPVRASRRSAEWCLKGVDQCWAQKAQFIRFAEKEEAKGAYEHARQVYRQRIAECEVE